MIKKIRTFLKENNLDALLINSTNEFLVEYNRLEENSRYILTGFSGSTGDAVVTEDKIYLFVDGRYHIQADNEVNHALVDVVKLQTGETMLSEMRKIFQFKTINGTKGNIVVHVFYSERNISVQSGKGIALVGYFVVEDVCPLCFFR